MGENPGTSFLLTESHTRQRHRRDASNLFVHAMPPKRRDSFADQRFRSPATVLKHSRQSSSSSLVTPAASELDTRARQVAGANGAAGSSHLIRSSRSTRLVLLSSPLVSFPAIIQVNWFPMSDDVVRRGPAGDRRARSDKLGWMGMWDGSASSSCLSSQTPCYWNALRRRHGVRRHRNADMYVSPIESRNQCTVTVSVAR